MRPPTVLKNNVEVSKQGQANTDLPIKYSMKYLHLRGVGQIINEII
jgi:hypothetical protein